MDGLSPSSQMSPTLGSTTSDFPPLMSRPNSSDACATIVQGLMAFNQSSDEDFSRKACESLVKKMKDKRDELDALIVSVYSRGDDSKKCITIARTLDGRLQVAGRKGFPHVVYAKIFRWPDLHKNELKHLTCCENAFDLKGDNVCVNPYHYERVINAGMGQIEVNRDDDDMAIIEDRSSQGLYGIKPSGQLPSLQMHGLGRGGPKQMMSPTAQVNNNRFMDFNNQMVNQMMVNQSPHHTSPNQRLPPQMAMVPPASTPQSHSVGPPSASPRVTPSEASTPYPTQKLPPTVPPVLNMDRVARPIGCPEVDPMEDNTYPIGHHMCEYQDNYKTIGNLRFSRRNIVCVTGNEPPDPPLDEQKQWVSMTYHENGKAIAQFQAKLSTLYIDSGFASGINRWCLGGISRNGPISKEMCDVLRRIGKGVRLSCKSNGDVWIQSFSHNPLFIQSHYLDREAGRGTGDVIHKLYPGARIKIYDSEKSRRIMKEQWLSTLLAKCVMVSNQDAERDVLLAETVVGPGGESRPVPLVKNTRGDPMQELFRFCLARISFVEGWGPEFPRHTIDECVCWIEIKLNQAFAFLDRLLTEVHGEQLIP